MERIFVMCLVVVGLVSTAYAALQGLPENFAGCTNPLDCPAGYCCKLEPMRYSTPTCVLKRQLGEICKPNNEPVNNTLYYPNGISLEVTNVYYAVCPCDSAFTCDRKSGVCASENGPVEGVLID